MLPSIIDSAQSPIDELVLCLTMAMDLDDNDKLYHSWHVAVVSDAIAHDLGLPTRPYIYLAALLHDLGGIGAPMHVMHYLAMHNSSNKLIPEVELHSFFSAQTIRIIPGLKRRHFIADIVLQHHEHADGTGFPNGLMGTEILLEAAIIHAADLLDINIYLAKGALDISTMMQAMQEDQSLPVTVVDALRRVLQDSNLMSILSDEKRLAEHMKQLYAMHSRTLFDDIQEDAAVEGVLSLVSTVIDHKHSYTQGHSARVSSYSAEIARYLGFPETDIKTLLRAGLVHDVGKLSVPREILDQKGRLDDANWQKMKRHAQISWDVLKSFSSLEQYAFAALHHERWDGRGYPFGLAGNDIPVFSRIMAVADALDAMTSHRPYRQIWSFSRAIQEMQSQAGRQFDPEIVKVAELVFGPGLTERLAMSDI